LGRVRCWGVLGIFYRAAEIDVDQDYGETRICDDYLGSSICSLLN
jgi:hypothetical protein